MAEHRFVVGRIEFGPPSTTHAPEDIDADELKPRQKAEWPCARFRYCFNVQRMERYCADCGWAEEAHQQATRDRITGPDRGTQE